MTAEVVPEGLSGNATYWKHERLAVFNKDNYAASDPNIYSTSSYLFVTFLCRLSLINWAVLPYDSQFLFFLVLSLGTKPEFINRPIWMKRLLRNSAQRYIFLVSWTLLLIAVQTVLCSILWHNYPSFIYTQASQKKFLDYIQTGAIEKMAKVLDKGLDPNFHDPDNGGEFPTMCSLSLRHYIFMDFFVCILTDYINQHSKNTFHLSSHSISNPFLWLRNPAVCGHAVRPVSGGPQVAGSGRLTLGLQK